MIPVRKLLSCLLLANLLNLPAFSQQAKLPVAVWYQRPTAYAFAQDGTASIFTTDSIRDFKVRLTVSENGSYTYTEIVKNDTVITLGAVGVEGEGLRFSPMYYKGQQLIASLPPIRPVYVHNKHMLILGFNGNPASEGPSNPPFDKVETPARYRGGQQLYLKTLYTSLAGANLPPTDSVYLHSFSVMIDKDGVIDVRTLKQSKGETIYLSAIKDGLLHLKHDFIPAMQNGRPVKGWFHFTLSY